MINQMIMETLPDISKKQKLEIELDIRLASIWQLLEDQDIDLALLSQFMRASYTRGYVDALTEVEGGRLLKDVPGYSISGRVR